MTQLTLRSATAADLPFIIGLVVADSVFPTGDDPANATADDYLTALAAIDADPNQEVLIAERQDEAIGCFQLSFIPGLAGRGMWRGLVEMVHVAPAHRGNGFGGEMMRWAIERCRARGCRIVQLTSNKRRLEAHRFYERLGFERSHDGFKLRL